MFFPLPRLLMQTFASRQLWPSRFFCYHAKSRLIACVFSPPPPVIALIKIGELKTSSPIFVFNEICRKPIPVSFGERMQYRSSQSIFPALLLSANCICSHFLFDLVKSHHHYFFRFFSCSPIISPS